MGTASTLLRQARSAVGLSQRALGQAAQVPSASIGRVETEHRSTSADNLDRLLRPTGHRLVAVPLVGRPAAEAAVEIGRLIETNNERAAFREFIQLADDLSTPDFASRVVLTFAPAPSTGSHQFDALIAALVQHRTDEVHAPGPAWTERVRPLAHHWVVSPYGYPERPIESFERFNITLDASELESV